MLGFGLTVAAIGIGIVFFELVLLIFVILLITFAARAIENRKTAIPGKKPEITVQNAAPAIVKAENDDDDVIAVIAAAVACMTQGASVVTAIRRVQGVSGPIWSQIGRQETMSVRQ